ncbi:MAG: YhjD/YihY/BrkB family envelope integrity protein [Ilumatobacteraceae bacterium]
MTTTELDDRWRRRRDRLVSFRAIGIPTAILRRFFHIDGMRKSMLMAFNLFISVIPLAIFAFALLSRVRNRFSLADVFIRQFRLHGETAAILRNAFPPNDHVLEIASVLVVGSFAISGFDVASAFQRTFAEAWQVERLRGWKGSARGAIWFLLVLAIMWLGQLAQRFPSRHGWWGYAVVTPFVIAGNYLFWLATPPLMLDKRLPRRELRPGAILGTVGSTALWALSLVILPSWFSWYGRGFGGIGIALALLSWIYVISIVWVVIVVISAVMWERSAAVDDVVELSGDRLAPEV